MTHSIDEEMHQWEHPVNALTPFHIQMLRFNSPKAFLQLAALPLCAALLLHGAHAANSGYSGSLKQVPVKPAASAPQGAVLSETGNMTVLINKSIPGGLATVKEPDTDKDHFQALNGTHFSHRCYVPYVLRTKEAAVEVCEIDPVTLQIHSWPESEVIHLVNGEVTITESNGLRKTYVAGDIFVLPQGFKGVWQQSGKLSKVVVRHPLFWKD